uniref:Single domain-containing protein n=1 Tax=Anopheles atroparvus TaxID=41427 RepID=A0AAG5DCC7_ANOAO
MGKMKVALFVGLTVAFMAMGQTDAAAAILVNATHPDHPGACYDSHREISIKPDEEVQLAGECAVMSCNAEFTLSFYSCGVSNVESPECVKTGQDLSKAYPECCKKYTCKDKDGKTYFL